MPSLNPNDLSQPRAARTRGALTVNAITAVLLLLGLGPIAGTASAQDAKVYTFAEVSNPPKLASSVDAARIIQESYPEDLKRRKVGGLVEVQFVVDVEGNVVASSVEVIDATQTALGEAARKAVTKLTFEPAKLNGSKVKSKVVLPIVYKAN